MITNSEINAVDLSPTKKDFYQIWNELMEVAGKLSERWDPTSTNESDPGIVLLKVLTAVADKLNYTIDANTLEAFMPSAAQEESMRKLTEMMGYNMKYFRSATTDVKISYNLTGKTALNVPLLINKYTNIKDIDNNINYITLEDTYLNINNTSKIVPCIEGELVECETDDNNIISIFHLDDNKRYFLPETQIAENGIFITNIINGVEEELWERVENLNTQNIGAHVFKFGYDSREDLPYIQFPDDISTIIEDGLKIKYLRTNGVNGNISPKTLCKMETPSSWSLYDNSDADYLNVDNYIVSNQSAANNGRNREGLTDAYNNYKKTIGTFDTLVTCRDYINKIYQMTTSETSSTPLVSNVIVSDIRDDINKAMTLCTFTDRGIEYKTMAKPVDLNDAEEINQSLYNSYLTNNTLLNEIQLGKLFKVVNNVNEVLFYSRCLYNGNSKELVKLSTRELTHFDLLIYPFRAVYGLNNKQEFIKSFKYDATNILEIQDNLEKNKTLSHNFIDPNKDEIACIKNYYKLTAKITTTKKVNAIEQADILGKVYSKLYENFNMRRVDFGEEIPYDSILSILETADTRIKTVSLEDPIIATKYCTVGGGEYEVMDITNTMDEETKAMALIGNKYYNKTVLNNVLAGRVELFNYDENFKPDFTESQYPSWLEIPEGGSADDATLKSYNLIYPTVADKTISAGHVIGANGVSIDPNGVHKLVTSFEIGHGASNVKLHENEVVQFRLPNLKTIKTYPAYVNYFARLDSSSSYAVAAIPATMQTLLRFIERGADTDADKKVAWEAALQMNKFPISLIVPVVSSSDFEVTGGKFMSEADWRKAKTKYHALFTKNEDNTYSYVLDEAEFSDLTVYYYPQFRNNSATDFALWRSWIMSINTYPYDIELNKAENKTNIKFKGLYKNIGIDFSKSYGLLVDNLHNKYKLVEVYANIISDPFESYYLPRLWDATVNGNADASAVEYHTENGLGQNAEYGGIEANKEYKLKDTEYLLINYTSSSSTEGNETKTKINEYYGPGTIIKPSFSLIDSEEYHKLHKYPKQDGFSFSEYSDVSNPAGMFTLGSNEQIEIRDYISVKLDEVSTNIYWQRQQETPDMYNRIRFEFDEDPVDSSGNPVDKGTPGSKCLSYTLKDGEYFYYTGANKTDIAWYGAGTKLKRTLYTPEIYKYASDDSISTEDIASQGLSAAIPWRPFDFSKIGDFDKSLSLIEYQYINLIGGDTLKTVTSVENSESDTPASTIEIDLCNTYKPIKSATYSLNSGNATDNSSDVSLPAVDFDNDFYWEVRSRLELNVGPTIVQTLYNRNSNGANVNSKIEVYGYDSTNHTPTRLIETLQPQLNIPLSIKTNNLYQTSTSEISTTAKHYSEDGILQQEKANFQMKVFETKGVYDTNGKFINLNNFGNSFTKLLFEDPIRGTQDITTAAVRLNMIIPENRFGLFMIYNNKISSSADSAKIRFISSTPLKASNNTQVVPKIFNYTDTTGSHWWSSENTSALNPNGYGCVKNDTKLWAVECSKFDTLTEVEFNALVATGAAIYKREAVTLPRDTSTNEGLDTTALLSKLPGEVQKPAEVTCQRLDYETSTLYNYTRVTSYENGNYYGTLLDEGGTNKTLYQLRQGINVIQVDASCGLEIYSSIRNANGGSTDVLILSSLDIIYNEPYSENTKYQTPINEKLMYKGTSLNQNQTEYLSSYEQILKDIKAVDPNYLFYYNVPVQNALGIDMNRDDDEDNLMHPSNWYDLNNINNKFVISEIDANYLPTGVTIARTSRSN